MNKNSIKQTLRGSGSYGYVNKVEDLNLGIIYAEKHLNIKKASSKDKTRFKQEFKIMNKFNHENLVKSYSIDVNNYTYIMEYCDLTLENYIKANNTKLSFDERKKIAIQFLNGISYLHNNGIYHRDLGLDNVLIKKYDNTVIVKIADFGLAKDNNELITSSKTDKNRGHFRDPLLEDFSKFNEKNEMYAIGYIIHYIFRGKINLYLENEDNKELKRIILKCTNIESINNRYNNVDELMNDVNNLKDKQFEENRIMRLNTKNPKNMLIELMYNSKDGDIWYNKFLSGESIDVGNKNIQLSLFTSRERERYISALNEMLNENLIRLENSGKGTKRYVLTENGYQYYENLNGGV